MANFSIDHSALKIAAIYSIVGCLWIVFSDSLMTLLSAGPQATLQFSLVKGWLFVILTGGMLYLLIAHDRHQLQRQNADISALNEELIASEEELRQQLDELIQREGEIHSRNLVMSILHQTALGFMNRLELNDLLSAIVAAATDLVGTPHGYISLLDTAEGVFRRRIGLGFYAHSMGECVKNTDGLYGWIYRSGEMKVLEDYCTWEHRLPDPFYDKLHATAQVPLKSGAAVIGILGVSFLDPARKVMPSEADLLARFAELASLAFENANLVATYKNELLERRQAEAALRISEAKNQALINAIPDLMLIMKRDGHFIDCKIQDGAGDAPADSFRGKTVYEMFPPAIAAQFMEAIELTDSSGTIQVLEYCLPVRGALRHYEARIVRSGDEEMLAIIRDITDRKKMEEQLEYLIFHDSLTGLYNRAYFEEEMRRLESRRSVEAGIIICDLDALKLINDTLGHSMGDEVLKAVARILKNSFRPSDLVARIGGDEFAILLPDNHAALFEEACRRIRTTVAEYNAGEPLVPVSLSLGFAVSGETAVTVNALFKEADNNMYREKLHRSQSTRNAIVQALLKALEVRDFITAGHGDRLQDLVVKLAAAAGVPEQHWADLRLLAQFHDIGKVGIPEQILFKTGRLTPEELTIMRGHCEIGYRIAKSAPDLEPVAEWILNHQEWWNGEGYPQGIAGEDIPVACRILAIADAYDAMTSDRPYRKALSSDQALAELCKFAGTQFDPLLVKLFTQLITRQP